MTRICYEVCKIAGSKAVCTIYLICAEVILVDLYVYPKSQLKHALFSVNLLDMWRLEWVFFWSSHMMVIEVIFWCESPESECRYFLAVEVTCHCVETNSWVKKVCMIGGFFLMKFMGRVFPDCTFWCIAQKNKSVPKFGLQAWNSGKHVRHVLSSVYDKLTVFY